jgi:thiol-disulfide isomerase/thioredoxin
MTLLATTVALTFTLSVLNLLLTYGIIRRMRMPGAEQGWPVAGEVIEEFEAVTTRGEPLSRAWLTGTSIVGFFSPGCPPCETGFPVFVQGLGSTSDRAVAVIVTNDGREAGDMLALAGGRVNTVVEAHDGPMSTAFGVTSMPVVITLEETRVRRVESPERAA